MGKVSKFGIFSPAVVGAKIALGESRLNKIRGKVRTPRQARARSLARFAEEDIMHACMTCIMPPVRPRAVCAKWSRRNKGRDSLARQRRSSRQFGAFCSFAWQG